jgi:uncharacterized membrane protein YedE/YeeE
VDSSADVSALQRAAPGACPRRCIAPADGGYDQTRRGSIEHARHGGALRTPETRKTCTHVKVRTDIDQRLVTGAALFGVGWGLVGLCPGPALTALVSGYGKALIFFVSMVAGMYAYRTLDLLTGMYTSKGAEVDG